MSDLNDQALEAAIGAFFGPHLTATEGVKAAIAAYLASVEMQSPAVETTRSDTEQRMEAASATGKSQPVDAVSPAYGGCGGVVPFKEGRMRKGRSE